MLHVKITHYSINIIIDLIYSIDQHLILHRVPSAESRKMSTNQPHAVGVTCTMIARAAEALSITPERLSQVRDDLQESLETEQQLLMTQIELLEKRRTLTIKLEQLEVHEKIVKLSSQHEKLNQKKRQVQLGNF
jgi:hypothetical protein